MSRPRRRAGGVARRFARPLAGCVSAIGMGWVVVSACGSGPCADAMCFDGIVIRVIDAGGEPIRRFEGRVRSTETSASFPFGCNGVSSTTETQSVYNCLGQGEALVFAPPDIGELRVRVEAGGTVWSRSIRPEFEPVRPRGPECGVKCRKAELDARLE